MRRSMGMMALVAAFALPAGAAGQQGTLGAECQPEQRTPGGPQAAHREYDVIVDVPNLCVERIRLRVQNLDARLALPGKRTPIDVALIPIGGHYTMDRHDAVDAARFVGAGRVVPVHFDTFPPIKTDAQAFKQDVEAAGIAMVDVLAVNDAIEL